MSVNKESFKIIGVIGKPHGIKGYVYVRFYTDYPDSINKDIVLFLDDKGTNEIKVEEILNLTVKRGERAAYKFYGVKNRSEAENLRGRFLYRKLSDKPVLRDGDYWIDDLTGCSVYTSGNAFIGVVKEIENHPSIDSLVIIEPKDYSNKDKLKTAEDINASANQKNKNFADGIIKVPMVDDYIEKIDIGARKIIISKLPEYI